MKEANGGDNTGSSSPSHSFLPFFVSLFLQRQLEVSLLRHPRQAGLAAQPAAGGYPVHGHEAAACPPETKVSFLFSPFLLDLKTTSLLRVSPGFPEPVSYWVCRFKPLQKVDGMSDSVCGSSQHCSSTPEQSVAAQSQHHQQYIGMGCSQRRFRFTRKDDSRARLLHPLLSRLLADTSHTLPAFPSPDVSPQSLPERITLSDVSKLRNLYRDHCEVGPIQTCQSRQSELDSEEGRDQRGS